MRFIRRFGIERLLVTMSTRRATPQTAERTKVSRSARFGFGRVGRFFISGCREKGGPVRVHGHRLLASGLLVEQRRAEEPVLDWPSCRDEHAPHEAGIVLRPIDWELLMPWLRRRKVDMFE